MWAAYLTSHAEQLPQGKGIIPGRKGSSQVFLGTGAFRAEKQVAGKRDLIGGVAGHIAAEVHPQQIAVSARIEADTACLRTAPIGATVHANLSIVLRNSSDGDREVTITVTPRSEVATNFDTLKAWNRGSILFTGVNTVLWEKQFSGPGVAHLAEALQYRARGWEHMEVRDVIRLIEKDG